MSLIDTFQDMVSNVPELVQPLVVALAGTVPFIEGEGAAAIGIIGGINPIVAAVAGAIGNFLCVTIVVLLSSRARQAVVSRSRRRTEALVTAGGAPALDAEGIDVATADNADSGVPGSKRQEKFTRAFERYGVPGVSLLGPLLLPTQFTSSMLAAAGIRPGVILFWQGIAIVGWTTIITLFVTGVLGAVG